MTHETPPDSTGRYPAAEAFDFAPYPTFALRADGTILTWNRAASETFGYSREEAVGQSAAQLLGATAISERQTARDISCTLTDKPGAKLKVLASTVALSDPSDSSSGIASVVTARIDPGHDWEELTRSRDALAQSELRLHEAQSIAGIGSWEFDLATGGIHWSPETFRLYGIDPSEPEPAYGPLLQMIHPLDRAFFQEKVRRAVMFGEPYDFDNRIVRADGSVCYTHAVGRPMRDERGKIVGLAGTAMDITGRKKAEGALRESESRFRAAFDNASIGMVLTGLPSRKFLQVNRAFREMTGYSAEELAERGFVDVTHPDDVPTASAYVSAVLAGKTLGHKMEKRIVRKNGQIVWTRVSMAPIRTEEGDRAEQNPPHLLITLVEDITSQKLAEERAVAGEERWELALQGTNDGLFDWDARSNKMFFSPRWKEMLGYRDDELPNKVGVWESLVLPEDLPAAQAAVQKHLDGITEHYVAEYRIRCKDGSVKWILARGKAVRDAAGNPLRMIGAHSDITARKSAEERLRFQALHDEMTGLANRSRFLERLEDEVRNARSTGTTFCLCVCDIDRFKSVNDRYGHQSGDEVLVFFASLLSTLLDVNCLAGRMGGDEFHIIFPATPLKTASAKLEEIRRRLSEQSFHSGKGPFTVSASFGVAQMGAAMATSSLLETADQALYRAKELGRNCVHEFAAAADDLGAPLGWTPSQWEIELRSALSKKQIAVDFQPVYRISDRRLVCFEALARWNHKKLGAIPPSRFIPIAERSGLIAALGLFVMERACEVAASWAGGTLGPCNVGIAVNVSAVQLFREDFVASVRGVLERTNLAPGRLKLELTESSLLADIEETIRKMCELRTMGVELLIDDFGTGYSCLSYLGRLPFTSLKIDRSFVHELNHGSHSGRMVSTLVTLAKEFGMNVIAEGIETPEQFDAVMACGCDEAQGYWLGHPARNPGDYLQRGEFGTA